MAAVRECLMKICRECEENAKIKFLGVSCAVGLSSSALVLCLVLARQLVTRSIDAEQHQYHTRARRRINNMPSALRADFLKAAQSGNLQSLQSLHQQDSMLLYTHALVRQNLKNWKM